ncbi:hypothetical protein GDO86_015830 [Hymenochirus boettgeri]|uniref:Uncharacterized protein n=1 Tax=Hymenochirus boettgeri TaxID=247094 RepID=A0A8T2JZU7_9PIPI|nr:hypothetical protein GDO86_015830 [Hymenochirus boettgeri]
MSVVKLLYSLVNSKRSVIISVIIICSCRKCVFVPVQRKFCSYSGQRLSDTIGWYWVWCPLMNQAQSYRPNFVFRMGEKIGPIDIIARDHQIISIHHLYSCDLAAVY